MIFCIKPSISVETHFYEITPFYTHSTVNLAFYRFWKKLIFLEKKLLENSWVFEISYYFTRILQQNCNNFVIKNFRIQNRAILPKASNWQVNVQKHIKNMAKNKNGSNLPIKRLKANAARIH